MKIQDKIKYGSRGTQLGGLAEELFQKLVPEAVNANKYWQKNNKNYDFMYKNMTIDVKYSSIYRKGKSQSWSIKLGGNANIFIGFLESEEGKGLEGCYIIMIPNGFVNVKNKKQLSRNTELFKDFQVDKEFLIKMLDEYTGIINN